MNPPIRDSPGRETTGGIPNKTDQTPIGSPSSSIVAHDPAALADLAAEHAARGWWVFPVLPNSKQPAISRWTELASADPVRVRSAWPNGHNIGIACGPSQLLVVDLDVAAEPKPLSPPWNTEPGVTDGLDVWAVLRERHDPDWRYWLSTYIVATPRGGLHLYFRNPANATRNGQWRNTTSKLGPMVDTRGAGGYVVAAGSVVNGKSYDALGDSNLARAPGWLAKLLTNTQDRPVTVAPTVPPRQQDSYVDAAFKNEIAAVVNAWEGSRNAQLNKSAFALARFVAAGQLDRNVVIGALSRAAAACGLSPLETRNTIRSAFIKRGAA